MEANSVRGPAARDRPGAARIRDVHGAGFPFRDILVASTYEPLADATATLVARALAERLGDVPVIRPVLVWPRSLHPALGLAPQNAEDA